YLALAALVLIPTARGAEGVPQRAGDPALLAMIPKIDGWTATEKARSYFPDTLYEYIDGAAESYIGYDFKELAVAEFAKSGTQASLTLEIYDMGNDLNAFGIYSAERFPDNKTMDIGTHGYIEGEVLNFIAGTDYVKLLCFNGGDMTASILETFARTVAAAAGTKGVIPALFSVFPKEGLVPNSEKYIRRNFMGFDFLGNGYLVSYKADGAEFEGFVIEPDKGQDTAALMKRLLDFFAGDGQAVEPLPSGHHVRNRYAQNLYLGIAGDRLCGINRVADGAEPRGAAWFERLFEAVKKRA
ncbi:MAG TPA: DUF6599 family protein, partial [Acidobacteriota bacterium]|nr:DUF6599 family protein [Acidobacteriota bacterium]